MTVIDFGNTKISDSNIASFLENYILGFYISMNYVVVMDVLQSYNDRSNNEFYIN